MPFVAKATGLPVAKIAAKVMTGLSLAELGIDSDPIPSHVSVKESVFPFRKFLGVDIVLGPEMRSTGEVMGISERFSIAFAKSQLAAGTVLPEQGTIFISVAAPAKEHMVGLATRLAAMGYNLMATEGTARRLEEAGIPVQHVNKLQEGHPNLLDYLVDGGDAADHEHAQRQGGPHRRRAHSLGGRGARRALHHHHPSGRRRGAGDGSPASRRDHASKPCKIASRRSSAWASTARRPPGGEAGGLEIRGTPVIRSLIRRPARRSFFRQGDARPVGFSFYFFKRR